MSQEFVETFEQFAEHLALSTIANEAFIIARANAEWQTAETAFREFETVWAALCSANERLQGFRQAPDVPKSVIAATSEYVRFSALEIDGARATLRDHVALSIDQCKRHARKSAKQADRIFLLLEVACGDVARYRNLLTIRGKV